MASSDVNTILVNGYLKLLDNLSSETKLDLIAKLSESVQTDHSKRGDYFYKAFGAWESNKSADEIIKEIKDSRKFDRQIEGF